MSRSATASRRTDDRLRLELLFGKAVITASDIELGPWTRLTEFRGEIPGRRYPFDLGSEPERFRGTRAVATAVSIDVDGARLGRTLSSAARGIPGIAGLDVELLEDEVRVAIETEADDRGAARIITRLALLPDLTGGQDLHLIAFDQLILGTPVDAGPVIFARALPHLLGSAEFRALVPALGPVVERDCIRVPAARVCLAEAFVRRRWKMPGAERLRWLSTAVAPGRASLRAAAPGGSMPIAAAGEPKHRRAAVASVEVRAVAAEAEDAFFSGAYARAAELYRASLRRFGMHPFLRNRYLAALRASDDPTHAHEARECADRALNATPDDAVALAARTSTAAAAGDIDLALATAERLAEALGRAGRDEDRVDALLFASRIAASRSPREGSKWVDRALRLAPRSPAVLRQRVRLARATGDADAFEDGLSRLLSLARSRHARARLHRELGRLARDRRSDFEAARVHLHEAVLLSEEDAELLLELAEVSDSAGRHVEAVRAYRQAADLLHRPDPAAAAAALAAAGRIWVGALRDTENAIIDLRRAVSLAPEAPEHHVALVDAVVGGRDQELAIRAVAAAAEAIDPDAPGGRDALVSVLRAGVSLDVRRGQLESADAKRRRLAALGVDAGPPVSVQHPTRTLGPNPLGPDPLGPNPLGPNPLGADPLGADPLGGPSGSTTPSPGLSRSFGTPRDAGANTLANTGANTDARNDATSPTGTAHPDAAPGAPTGGSARPAAVRGGATQSDSDTFPSASFAAAAPAPTPPPDPAPARRAREALEAARSTGDIQDLVTALPEAAEHTADSKQRAAMLSELGQLLYYELEDPARAVQYLEEAQRVDPDGAGADYGLLSALEDIYETTASAEGLMTIYRRKLAQAGDPEIRSVYRLLMAGVLFEQLGRPDDAITSLEEVLEDDPRNVPALRLRARIWQSIGRTNDAADALESLVGMPEVDPFECQDLLRELGRLEWQSLGRLDKASERFERLLSEIPGDTDCISSLKQIYAKARRWDRVVDVLRRELGILAGAPDAFPTVADAVAVPVERIPEPLRPTFGQILTEAALIVHERLERPVAALEAARSASKLAPTDVFIHEQLLELALAADADADAARAAIVVAPQLVDPTERTTLYERVRGAAERAGRLDEFARAAGISAPDAKTSSVPRVDTPTTGTSAGDAPTKKKDTATARMERLDAMAERGAFAEAVGAIDAWLPGARRPALRRELLLRKGRWLLDRGADARSALLPLKGALILDPTAAETRLELLRASCRLGDVSQATDQLRHYLAGRAEETRLEDDELHRLRCAIDDLTAMPKGPGAEQVRSLIDANAPGLAQAIDAQG